MEHKLLSLDNFPRQALVSGRGVMIQAASVSGHTQSLSGYNQERATSQHSSAFSGSEFFYGLRKNKLSSIKLKLRVDYGLVSWSPN